MLPSLVTPAGLLVTASTVPGWRADRDSAEVASQPARPATAIVTSRSNDSSTPATGVTTRSGWGLTAVARSPRVPSLSHDVAPEALRRASATHLHGCRARCRCCSDAGWFETGCLVQHLWCDYLVLINHW